MPGKKSESPSADQPLLTVTGTVVYSISGERVIGEFTVPAEPARVRDLLPAFRQIAESVVDAGVRKTKADGQTISCKKGCAACCRQLIPITPVEAHRLREMIDRLPRDRRLAYLQRFASSREKLARTGIHGTLMHPELINHDEIREVGLKYFELGIACPFLEEESCSIYEERPISCREYLVTSPAEHCASPTEETVTVMPIAAKISNVVGRLGAKEGQARWVPLITALVWADQNPEPKPEKTGPEIMQDFFQSLGKSPAQ